MTLHHYRRVLIYLLSRSYMKPRAVVETRQQLIRVLSAVQKRNKQKKEKQHANPTHPKEP